MNSKDEKIKYLEEIKTGYEKRIKIQAERIENLYDTICIRNQNIESLTRIIEGG